MKNLVFVIGIMGNGGAERVIATISNALVKKGINVHIITIYGDRQDYTLHEKIDLIPICCTSKFRVFRPIERVLKIRRIIKNRKADCVISFLTDVNIHVIISMLGLNTKLIVSERNDPQKDPSQKWMRKVRDVLYKFADGFVFQTPDARGFFTDLLKNKKSVIIPNPIKDNLPYYNQNNTSKEFITACRLNTQKNLPMMIEAFERISKEYGGYLLSVYGEGPERMRLQDIINDKRLNNCISLCGFSKDIHKKMQNAFCFVISSDYEGISNSMLEALAIGVPVIATDCPVGGARMFIRNMESGYLTSCGNIDSLYQCMKRVIDSREEAIACGTEATKIRSQLTVSKIVDSWIRFVNEICS